MIGNGQISKRLGWLLATWLTLQALLLPVYGPWLDVHFAGRQAYHDHLYLAGVNPRHHDSPDTGDMVNLPTRDAAQEGLFFMVPPAANGLLLALENSNLVFTLEEESLSLQDTAVPPLEKPPWQTP
ncbi:MAG: hypothetical protein L0332_01315 [Chloroflexi bacterium]|nr:hypothetical protein [Chloroflexota bacterium]MCI0577421.1 hypothetical protein [Chloroflexota bacterium]MCI0725361.1 hypothetical protein [Chloroflexota bacterium]